MGRTLITALLLAHNAANALLYPELLPAPTKVLNNLVAAAAAATGDPGVEACSIALAVVSSCEAISGFADAPEATQAACLCCVSQTIALDEYYGSCADYIESNFPGSSTQYSAMSGLATACDAEVPTCGVGAVATGTSTGDDSSETGATDSPTNTPTGFGASTATAPIRTTASRVGGSVPPQCTSLTDLIASCTSATPSLTASTAKDSDAASCLCYATSGGTSTFTTGLDDLATECAPWAKTAAPSAYSAISAFEGFCADYEPTSTDDSPSETSAPTTTSRPILGGGGGGSGVTTSPLTSARTTAKTTTSASSNPGTHTSPGGVMIWAANLVSLALSFFVFV